MIALSKDYLISELERLSDLKRRTESKKQKEKIQMMIDMIKYEIRKG